MSSLLSNLMGILVRGLDGSGWLVSHGCRGIDRPFVGIVMQGLGFWWSNLSKAWKGLLVVVEVRMIWFVYEADNGIVYCTELSAPGLISGGVLYGIARTGLKPQPVVPSLSN